MLDWVIKVGLLVVVICLLGWCWHLDSKVKELDRFSYVAGWYIPKHEGDIVRLKILVEHLWLHQSDWEELLPPEEQAEIK